MKAIKVCGMKHRENIRQVSQLPIQYMGFIFYPKSARYVKPESLKPILRELPPRIQKVGVFVNEEMKRMQEIVQNVGLDILQLHGDESPALCQEMQHFCKVMKAFRVDEHFDFQQTKAYRACDFFLFDAKGKAYGGNGIQFEWVKLTEYQGDTPFFLSGGIGAKDQEKLQAFHHPSLVGFDVNSGFELEAGRKDAGAIEEFAMAFRV